MAVLYITEYDRIAIGAGAGMAMGAEPAKASQSMAITGSTTQSNAFGTTTAYIRVHTDVICSVSIGSNPTAAATTARMAANQTEYFAVQAGHKIAVITNV